MPPIGHLTCPEAYLVIIICIKVLLASGGWRPDILLNVLQCTRETSLLYNSYSAQDVNSVEKLCPRDMFLLVLMWKFVLEPVLQFRILSTGRDPAIHIFELYSNRIPQNRVPQDIRRCNGKKVFIC